MAEKLGPYELDRVHCVEALEALRALPDHSVDALIADPPYSSGGFSRSDRAQDPSKKYMQGGTKRVYPEFEGDRRDGRSWLLWCTLWLTQCRRVVRPGGMGMIFSDWRQLPNAIDALQAGGFVYRGIVVWAKGADCRVGHTGYFRPQAEYVVWGSSGHLDKAPGRGPWPGVVQVRVDHREKLHMTGKPLAVMQHLVQAVAPGGWSSTPSPAAGRLSPPAFATAVGASGSRCPPSTWRSPTDASTGSGRAWGWTVRQSWRSRGTSRESWGCAARSADADGGVIQFNPSPIGGTWAWCHVNATGERIRTDSGVILPRPGSLPLVTNNFSEHVALVRGWSRFRRGGAGGSTPTARLHSAGSSSSGDARACRKC